MPRVADIYQRPPGIDAVPNQTIESVDYNTNVADVEFDLNFPRPIVAGGTGANSAVQARDNLDAEVAMQTVTDFNTHTWEAGSFKAFPGAINSPDGAGASTNLWLGTATVVDNDRIILEARSPGGNITYVRRKSMVPGVWGVWTPDGGSGAFVLKTGDTMTGDLTISKNNPALIMNRTDAGAAHTIFRRDNKNRWSVYGGADTEIGGNNGSNFYFVRYNDAGDTVLSPHAFVLERATGNAIFGSAVTVNGLLNANASMSLTGKITTSNNLQFGTGASVGMNGDGTNVLIRGYANNFIYFQTYNGGANIANFSSAGLNVTGTIISSGTASIGGNALVAGATVGENYLDVKNNIYLKAKTAGDNPFFYITDEAGNAKGALGWYRPTNTINLSHYGANSLSLRSDGICLLASGFAGRQGSAGASYGQVHNFYWTGAAIQAWVDTTNVGNIALTSDYRTKKDIADLPSMWGTVKALRPISYTQAEFNPPNATKEEGKPAMFVADDIERWGFVAHELQETLIPSAATGMKDAPDIVQSPNPWTIIAAMTKTLQEAMARIEALEELAHPR